MRLFIAIKFNNEMIRASEDVQASMRNQGMRGNFTHQDNLHLTLAFIGDYPDPDHVLDVMDSVVFEPFEIVLDGIGNFGDLWWIGLCKSDPLNSYVKRLRHALSDAGIPFDKKRFSPHITLIRRASIVIRPEISVAEKGMTVSRISLFRSDRGKSRMIYTELGCIDVS